MADFFSASETAEFHSHARQGHHEHRPEVGIVGDHVEPIQHFDFAEIDKRLGWEDEQDRIERARKAEWEKASESLARVLRFLAGAKTVSSAGARTFALLVATRPDLLPAGSQTASALARELGITKQALAKYQSELFRTANGFRGPRMLGASARAERRDIARRQHRGIRIAPRNIGPTLVVNVRSKRDPLLPGRQVTILRSGVHRLDPGKVRALEASFGPPRNWSCPVARFWRRNGVVLAQHTK